MLRRPLPVPGADRLVNLSAPGPKPGSTSCNNAGSCEDVFSYSMLRDLEGGQKALAGLAAHRPFQGNLSIPAMVARLDPNLPVVDLITLPQQVRENLLFDRMIASFSTVFASLATLLAAIGLYAVLAYGVALRTREIGVRMALGADTARVRRLVLRQVGVMGVAGGLIGLAAAIGIGRAARSVLYQVEGHDPLAVAGAVLVLALVAAAAGYLPARRASRVHPMEALRYE
jgi:ABC-type antimicrobial peptide transport system permease subunit